MQTIQIMNLYKSIIQIIVLLDLIVFTTENIYTNTLDLLPVWIAEYGDCILKAFWGHSEWSLAAPLSHQQLHLVGQDLKAAPPVHTAWKKNQFKV